MGSPEAEILAVIREVLSPLVRADGGELHVVSVAERSVLLHLSGRFSGCPGNTLARRRVIEPILAKKFPGLKEDISSGPHVPRGAATV
jgi:Fe-S cluster biogenesis protein NfuA